jgi:hypothetical protein
MLVRLVPTDSDDGLQCLCYVLLRMVIAGIQGAPGLIQVLHIFHYDLDSGRQALIPILPEVNYLYAPCPPLTPAPASRQQDFFY